MTSFHLIPHTHWDREWYLSEAAFRVRLVPVLDELLAQLARDRDGRFVLDGQTVLVEDYLAARPEAEAAVGEAVRRGALEVGPWYVLTDLLIPSGESLIRNLLEGARDAGRLGRRLDVLYSPDAFGHPAALPTLAREFGIRFAVVRRGLGRPRGLDRDFFRWDGVLTYHLPRDGYEVGYVLTRSGPGLSARWRRIRDEATDRAVGPVMAVFVGADHHAAPPDLAGLRRRVQRLERGALVRISGLAEFFAAWSGVNRAPAITGELRRGDGHCWVLQGVHGTRSRLKRAHALAELALGRLTEPLAALSVWRGGRDHRAQLRHTWRSLLRSQFHDTLCGCSADEVAATQAVRLDAVRAASREIAREALHDLAGHDPDAARESAGPAGSRLLLWNPCARARRGITTAELTFFRRHIHVGPGQGGGQGAPAAASSGLRQANGRPVALQILGRRPGQERLDSSRHYPDQDEVERVWVAFRAPTIEGLGLGELTTERLPTPARATGMEASPARLANRFVAVRVDATGRLALEDRRNGQRYHGLLAMEDEPDGGDTYTFSRGPGRARRRGTPISRAVVTAGPLVGALEARWTMPGAGAGDIAFRLLVVLHADSPVVRLRLDIENRAMDHRLRARFPIGAGTAAWAGVAFGAARRVPVQFEADPLERPAPTAPAHQFVAAGSATRGLVLMAPGCFEYEWDAGRTLSITLLRSIGELSRGDLPERSGHAAWPMPTPGAQEPGGHTVQLAICPADGAGWQRPDRLFGIWEEAFLPLQALWVRESRSVGVPGDLGAALHGEGLTFTAAKPAESGRGLVLRCCNPTGAVREGRWTFARTLRAAHLVRADETVVAPLRLGPGRRSVRIRVPPGQICSILAV